MIHNRWFLHIARKKKKCARLTAVKPNGMLPAKNVVYWSVKSTGRITPVVPSRKNHHVQSSIVKKSSFESACDAKISSAKNMMMDIIRTETVTGAVGPQQLRVDAMPAVTKARISRMHKFTENYPAVDHALDSTDRFCGPEYCTSTIQMFTDAEPAWVSSTGMSITATFQRVKCWSLPDVGENAEPVSLKNKIK